MNPAARIIDANANRAREALRVMEDIARFALDNGPLTASLKQLRHDLQAAMALLPLDRAALVASRDTEADVGVPIKTDSELSRANLGHTTAAAASRLTEALRSLEEAAKTLPAPQAAAAFESLRYRAYTADKELTLALNSPRHQWRLCVLITESLCKHHSWLKVAELAIDGGADCLQLREKSLDDRELLRRAKYLLALARPRGVAVVINDRPDIALLSGADAVHLGQTDLPIAEVRALGGQSLRGGSLLIGVSTENLGQARVAGQSGADYIALGPMFPTTTKERPRLAGPQYVRSFLADEALARIPHLAIGGINAGNVAHLADAGCRSVAVSSFVCSAPDPAAACEALLEHLPAPIKYLGPRT
jgi:thiamine-phosphate pyrophosphorylase